MSIVVITGAAGLVGSMLRPRLARPGRTLRVLDIAPLTAGPGEEAIAASVTDMEAMTAACQGADAVVHLAGIPGEASWERICELNINGSYVAFEAARRAGAPRVIFASSNHAVGFTPRSDFPVPDYAFPKPDTYYGVSKAAVEALAAMYHDRYGMDAICLRILSCFPRPQNVRMLSTWLSPDDAGALRGLPDRRTARVPRRLRRLRQHPRRLGLAGRGPGARLPAAGRRGGLRRRDHRRARRAGPGRPGAALPGRRVHSPRRPDPPPLKRRRAPPPRAHDRFRSAAPPAPLPAQAAAEP